MVVFVANECLAHSHRAHPRHSYNPYSKFLSPPLFLILRHCGNSVNGRLLPVNCRIIICYNCTIAGSRTSFWWHFKKIESPACQYFSSKRSRNASCRQCGEVVWVLHSRETLNNQYLLLCAKFLCVIKRGTFSLVFSIRTGSATTHYRTNDWRNFVHMIRIIHSNF
jgi:hypothetical protein